MISTQQLLTEWVLSGFQGIDNFLLKLPNQIKTDSYLINYNKIRIKLKLKPDKAHTQKENYAPISLFTMRITTAAAIVVTMQNIHCMSIFPNNLLYFKILL